MSPSRLFRIVAVAEAITWALLIFGMILKYGTRTTDVMVSIGGGLHGFVFLVFLVVLVLLWISQRWTWWAGLLGLVSAVVPFATVPFEIWAERRGMLGARWRLGAQGEAPRGPLEKSVALVMRRPVLSGVVAIVAVAVLFSVMVWAGPPVPKA